MDPHVLKLRAVDVARALLADCDGPPPAAVSVQVTVPGIVLRVEVRPEADPGEPLTQCERDVLAVLADAGLPLTAPAVIAELARRGLLHGDSTVRRALTRLAGDAGYLRLERRAPRGYRLAGEEGELVGG